MTFAELGLDPKIQKALDDLGYETPTPIQAQAIPHLMQGLDLLGHAPTGTGKTVVAALDYRRLRASEGPLKLLFVAHRREILDQSLATFRVVLKDGAFGDYSSRMLSVA